MNENKIDKQNWNNHKLPYIKSNRFYKSFPFRPEPIEGESISSWMVRVASANYAKLSTLTGKFGFYPSHTDFDISKHHDIIQFFTECTGVSNLILNNMSFYKTKNDIDDFVKTNKITSLFFKELLFTNWRVRKNSSLRYCPLCLEEDKIPFFRKEWRLNYLTVCPTHKCLLESSCPECNSAIAPFNLNWDLKLNNCYRCNADLTKSQVTVLSDSDPLLKEVIAFANTKDIKIVHKILSLAWFIARNCQLSDSVFNNHPLTKDEKLLELWKISSKNSNKKSIFTDIKATYLLIGTAILLYQNEALLNKFLGEKFTSKELFWTNKPYFCPQKECNFTETSYTRMLIHIKRHTGDRDYYCDKCGKKFLTKWDFENHIKLYDEPHPFQCPVKECNKKFRHEKQYIHHLRADHKIKPYACNICNKRFDRKYNLETHIRSHTGEKPYICEKCGKGFSQKSELTVHLRTHTGEKPYICDVCGKDFTQSHSLTEHIRTHTDERPYACPNCEKRYKRKHHLDGHIMAKHTGEKPFKCEKCGKGFSDKSNIKTHMASHSDERKYVCDVCGKSYKYSSGLSKHKKEMH